MVTGDKLSWKLRPAGSGSHVIIPMGFVVPLRGPRRSARRCCFCCPHPYYRPTHIMPVATPLLHCSPDDLGNYLYNLPPFLPAKQVRYAFGTVAITIILLSLTRMAVMRCCCVVTAAASSRKNHDTQQLGHFFPPEIGN